MPQKILYHVSPLPKAFFRGPSRKNVVLLKPERDWLIIDPGAAINAPFVLNRIEKQNLSIAATLITHAHPDHGSKAFQDGLVRAGFSGMTYAPNADLRRMNGFFLLNHEIAELHRTNPAAARIVYPIQLRPFRRAIVRWAYGPQEPPIVTTANPGDVIHGLRVLAFPGHTPDEMGFWHEESRTLFSGDLIQFDAPHSCHLSLILTSSNIDQAFVSLRAILKLQPRTMIPSHNSIIENDPEQLRRRLQQGLDDYEHARDVASTWDPQDIFGFAKKISFLLPNPGYNWFERRCTAFALLRRRIEVQPIG